MQMLKYSVLGASVVGALAVGTWTFPHVQKVSYVAEHNTPQVEHVAPDVPEMVAEDTREVVKHVPLPSEVKAIYMTSCVAGTHDFRDRLIQFIDETEINAVVIDIKDFSGTISFNPISDNWKGAWEKATCGARDMKGLIARLHEKNVFVIGRITVFQDPYYANLHPELAVQKKSDGTVWKDGKGLSFIDVGSQKYWDHIIDLSVDAYTIGFDELNYDYVRYPSDGNMKDIAFPQSDLGMYGGDKQANLEAFFKYLNEELDDETRYGNVRHEHTGRASTTPWTSADLFGMTTSNFDDLSIGQVQERAAPYFDFIAPMVYPSHYPPNFIGLSDPNEHPYKVVHYAMSRGVERMGATTTPMEGFLHRRIGTSTPPLYEKTAYGPDKFRTWIQDFDYGGDYDAADVRAQIQASVDAGVDSWMVWAPSNIYTRAAFFDALGTTTSHE